MRIALKYRSYNARRYSRPWIGKITAWPIGGKAEIKWGSYLGDDAGGEVEIEAQIGDIIRSGQKDGRGGNTSADWYIVDIDGGLIPTDAAGARKHWAEAKIQKSQIKEVIQDAKATIDDYNFCTA